MIRHYFLAAWRSLRKSKVSSLINLAGLSTGLACFIIILLYVENEMSYDRYHKNADRIYRVVKDFVNDDGSRIPDATTPPALSVALRKDIPEVASATRIFPAWGRKYLIENGEKKFYETNLLRIDSNFFEVFDFPFVSGRRESVFQGPNSIVLTQRSAQKYFGSEDPMGKTVKININNGQHYVVTGILKDVPENSHFTFDFLIPFVSSVDSLLPGNWKWNSFYTYALLKPSAAADAFAKKLQPLYHRYRPEDKSVFYTQALTDIHLHSQLKWELGVNNNISSIRILLLIAVFVIVIAATNYINLVTAQAAKRAKEVGVRKTSGASRRSLITQFLTESVCITFASLIIALVIVQLLLPSINNLLQRSLTLFTRSEFSLWMQVGGITLLVSFLSGLYPAIYLSSFKPIKVLKGKFALSYRGGFLRKGLVVFQFILSIVLLLSFCTIYRQVKFMTTENPGFNQENILLVSNVRGTGSVQQGIPGSWTDRLRQIPAVTNVARGDGIPGSLSSTNGISSAIEHSHISLNFMRVDHEFLPAFQVPMVEGRNFYASKTDSLKIILNEKAAEELGLQKPYINQVVSWDDESGSMHPVTIIGVVKNFHFSSFHEAIKPFGFIQEEDNGSTFFIKLHTSNISDAVSRVREVWNRYNPDKPFEFSFQDEQTEKMYQSDVKFKLLFSGVTVLAVVIACLGLLGLVIFTADARGKEIGIRKILGATPSSLYALLAKDFLSLLMIAFILASPVGWWVMQNWLQNFAYRVNIPWWTFALSGFTAIFIACVTISYEAVKAAVGNPVAGLRNE